MADFFKWLLFLNLKVDLISRKIKDNYVHLLGKNVRLYKYFMINSKLINLYLTLDKPELRKLNLWLRSPIHNQHKEVVLLFDYLGERRKINAVSTQKKRVYSKVYPNEEYQENKFNVLMSYCLKNLLAFIGFLKAESEGFYYEKFVVNSLSSRKMFKMAEKSLDNLGRELQENQLMNAQKAMWEFQKEVEKYLLVSTKNRTVQPELTLLFEQLNIFYVLSMLKYACVAVSQSNISKKESFSIEMLNEVLHFSHNSKHPVVQLYYNSYKSILDAEEADYYEKASCQFLDIHPKLDKSEQRDILLMLINYSIKKLNTGISEFRRKAFDWYKWGLVNEILIKDNYLSRFSFINIASLGLKLKEFGWVASFIDAYSDFIEGKHRSNYVHYTTAKLFFYQKEYKKTQQLLLQVEYEDIFLNLDAKTMLLEIYYEEKSYDALEALLVSFSRYLQRKSVIAYHKQVYKNIIQIIRKMLDVAPYDKEAVAKLKSQIENTYPIAEKEWLLQQVDKL